MTGEFYGVHRIAMARGKLVRTFDDRLEVPSTDSYFSSYNVSTLPLLCSWRNRYITHTLDKKKGLRLNYGLRAAMLELSEHSAKDEKLIMVHATVNFSESFTARLEKMNKPISYYGKRVKGYLKELGVDYFWLVIEEGKRRKNQVGRRLHAHIVLAINHESTERLKLILSNRNEVYYNGLGQRERRAVYVATDYEVPMYHRYMTKDKVELMQMEIDDYPEVTAWGHSNFRQALNGIAFVKKVKGINVGIADYLSKQLDDILLPRAGRNFYISRSLVKKMEARIESVIYQNKLASGMYR